MIGSLIIASLYFFARAMGTETTIKKKWVIENYTITHTSSLAWVGPPTEQIYLQEYIIFGLLNKTVGYLHQSDFPNNDDCSIEFKNHTFNKCTNKITSRNEQ